MASIALIKMHFRGNRHSIRNPSSRKGNYGQNMGVLKNAKLDYRKGVKLVKVTILYLVVVVLLLLLQFRLAYLNNQTEMRNETLCTDTYP